MYYDDGLNADKISIPAWQAYIVGMDNYDDGDDDDEQRNTYDDDDNDDDKPRDMIMKTMVAMICWQDQHTSMTAAHSG